MAQSNKLHDARFPDLRPVASPRRFAIVTTITDNYIGLGATFLLSLKEQLKILDEADVILFQDPSIAPLSPENRRALRAILPDLAIVDVDFAAMVATGALARYGKDGIPDTELDARLPLKKAVYVKLSVLRLASYERTLLLDADLLVLRDFSELFALPVEIACVGTGSKGRSLALGYSPAGRKAPPFNSGVLLLGPTCRGGDWFARAVDLLEARVGTLLQDQSVFNGLFAMREILFLPKIYNWKIGQDEKEFSRASVTREAKIVHFIGPSKDLLKRQDRADDKLYRRFHGVQRRTGTAFDFTL